MTANSLSATESRAAINALLDDFLSQQITAASQINPNYQDLWADIERLMNSGGKRLRPQIMLLAYHMLGGRHTADVLPAAASLELLHLGMLIHDDVIDRDDIRYGVPNITGSYKTKYAEFTDSEYDQTHYAHSASILAGDLLLSSAYLLMAKSSVNPSTILDIQQLLGRSIFEVIGGELIDTEAAFRDTGNSTSETIALYKTASYSFIMPLLVGATLANLSSDRLDSVRELGKNLGIAFQLRDDILGVFGDESKTGKSASGDIREGKRTYMVEQFYILANTDQRAEFDAIFGHPDISGDQVTKARTLLVESNALQKTEDMIEQYEKASRQALSSLSVEPSYLSQFEELIGVTTKRAA